MELVLIDSDGAKVTAGFMSTHKGIFGGSSTDPTFRAEPGHAFRFFVGGSETAQFTPDLALGLFPVAEPAAASDMGKLYIDIADGDLKIKFANGTVKTIATN